MRRRIGDRVFRIDDRSCVKLSIRTWYGHGQFLFRFDHADLAATPADGWRWFYHYPFPDGRTA